MAPLGQRPGEEIAHFKPLIVLPRDFIEQDHLVGRVLNLHEDSEIVENKPGTIAGASNVTLEQLERLDRL